MAKAQSVLSIPKARNAPKVDVGALIDQYGQLDAEAKALGERLGAIRAEIMATGVTDFTGSYFKLSISESVSHRFDQAFCKETMGEAWMAQFKKPSQVTTVRITPRKDALANLGKAPVALRAVS